MDFESISKFIDLVSHPEKYKQALVELSNQHAKIQAAIGTTTVVSEIASNRAQAKAGLELAKKKIEQAQEEAAKLVADTKAALVNEVKRLEDRATELVAKEQTLVDRQKVLDELKSAHAEREAEIAAKEAHLVEWHNKLANEQQEISDRLAKLRDVMA